MPCPNTIRRRRALQAATAGRLCKFCDEPLRNIKDRRKRFCSVICNRRWKYMWNLYLGTFVRRTTRIASKPWVR